MDNSRKMNPPMFWEMQPDGQWVSLEPDQHPQVRPYLEEVIGALEAVPTVLSEPGPIEHLKL